MVAAHVLGDDDLLQVPLGLVAVLFRGGLGPAAAGQQAKDQRQRQQQGKYFFHGNPPFGFLWSQDIFSAEADTTGLNAPSPASAAGNALPAGAGRPAE